MTKCLLHAAFVGGLLVLAPRAARPGAAVARRGRDGGERRTYGENVRHGVSTDDEDGVRLGVQGILPAALLAAGPVPQVLRRVLRGLHRRRLWPGVDATRAGQEGRARS